MDLQALLSQALAQPSVTAVNSTGDGLSAATSVIAPAAAEPLLMEPLADEVLRESIKARIEDEPKTCAVVLNGGADSGLAHRVFIGPADGPAATWITECGWVKTLVDGSWCAP